MTQHSSICKLIIYFTILMMLVSAGCSPTPTAMPTSTAAPFSTPKRLKLINGELDVCMLVLYTDIEKVLGIQTIRQNSRTGANIVCKYISATDDQVVLVIFVITDATLKKAKDPYSEDSALEEYELIKLEDLNFQKEIGNPDSFKVEDIDNLGDQAYYTEGTLLEINVMKNKIYYSFGTSPIDSGGIGYDALLKLAKIALQRMP